MRVLYVTLFAAYVALLSGCNTMEGVGEDMKAAGEGIDEKAEEKKGY
ncbi:MAG: entericidin A/B family lipoprotein [Gammaproteobacteria bacterium]|nr:entericidin A/B family lipoprotein [Gammaproteobacteria bacterium]